MGWVKVYAEEVLRGGKLDEIRVDSIKFIYFVFKVLASNSVLPGVVLTSKKEKPSLKKVAKLTGIDLRRLYRAISGLENKGLISRVNGLIVINDFEKYESDECSMVISDPGMTIKHLELIRKDKGIKLDEWREILSKIFKVQGRSEYRIKKFLKTYDDVLKDIRAGKKVEEEKPRRKYGSDVVDIANYLKAKLKKMGCSLPRDWHIIAYSVTDSMFKDGVSKEDLIETIDKAFDDEFWGSKIKNMDTIRRVYNELRLKKNGKGKGWKWLDENAGQRFCPQKNCSGIMLKQERNGQQRFKCPDCGKVDDVPEIKPEMEK